MGIIKPVLSVKLFTGITFCNDVNIDELIRLRLLPVWGREEMRSDVFPFSTFTDYYRMQMGDDLYKVFIAFTDLVHPEELPDIKVRTNQIEQSVSGPGKRRINIDPGYLTPAKIVLATTKDYSHRLYLNRGIYGDLHLSFARKSYRVQPWTYPDYGQPDVIVFFNQLRSIYMKQLSGVPIETSDL